jgi:ornithine cyclodeaminase/alanine dehydrogenase-like protein (mu-crystallin family)
VTPAPPLFLSAEAIAARADLRTVMAQMKHALLTGQRRAADVPLRTIIVRTDPLRAFGVMPALSEPHRLYVTKVASLVAGGARAPSVHALVVACASDSGEIVALLDGAAITHLKCAAITALVTDHCAPLDVTTAAVIGAGVQARAQIRALYTVRSPRELRLYSPSPQRVAALLTELERELPGVRLIAARSADAAVQGAGLIATATTSPTPVFTTRDLADPVHINCMGAHTPDTREVPRAVLETAELLVEDRLTAIAEAGALHQRATEIDDLLAEPPAAWRRARTVFSSTGHAFLDLVTTACVLRHPLTP